MAVALIVVVSTAVYYYVKFVDDRPCEDTAMHKSTEEGPAAEALKEHDLSSDDGSTEPYRYRSRFKYQKSSQVKPLMSAYVGDVVAMNEMEATMYNILHRDFHAFETFMVGSIGIKATETRVQLTTGRHPRSHRRSGSQIALSYEPDRETDIYKAKAIA